MEKIAISLLLFLSGVLGVDSTPDDAGPWNLTQNWKVEGDHFVLKAESSQIPLSCRENPKKNLQTPMIIHGVHQICHKIVLSFLEFQDFLPQQTFFP